VAQLVRQEVLDRLLLAKSLHLFGESACRLTADRLSFTRGLLLLHDAADAALGAIADHLHAPLKDKTYILNYYSLIRDADSQHRAVPYQTQVRNLNSIRVAIKHLGVFPDPTTSSHFPNVVGDLLEQLCNTYLDCDLGSLSLASMIESDTVKALVLEAEQAITDEDYKVAIEKLAFAMCRLAGMDSVFAQALVERKRGVEQPAQMRFSPETDTIDFTVKLIQHGVDPYLYRRFKTLTPAVWTGIGDTSPEFKWSHDFGHPANWTLKNAQFCLEFCVDSALKFQRRPQYEIDLVHYMYVYEDILQPVGEEASVWDRPSEPMPGVAAAPDGERKVLRTLKKGERITGLVPDPDESVEEWLVLTEDVRYDDSPYNGLCWVARKEVTLSQRELETQEKSSGS